MGERNTIVVKAESQPRDKSLLTGNTPPLLNEIHYGLARLRDTNEPTIIDLLAIPLAETERNEILSLLGVGEVRIHLDAFGDSRIWESRFPGVWVADHYDAGGQRIVLQVEIARFPALACSQPEDIDDGLLRLESELAALSPEASSRNEERY